MSASPSFWNCRSRIQDCYCLENYHILLPDYITFPYSPGRSASPLPGKVIKPLFLSSPLKKEKKTWRIEGGKSSSKSYHPEKITVNTLVLLYSCVSKHYYSFYIATWPTFSFCVLSWTFLQINIISHNYVYWLHTILSNKQHNYFKWLLI